MDRMGAQAWKATELNRLLRGAQDTTFLAPPAVPADIRYVITLDADTRLPRETVGRLIGKMAHPLNQPRLDTGLGRVVEGYGILQPRVTPALPVGREGSLFLRVFSSATGIDPYAAAVSDVYQDLFGEGTYTGKGIYDVDALEAAMAGRVPESTLLSHDLFEGIFARAGLASDVEVVEDFPARYDVAALRHHRWARGDWQLLPWIFGRGPLADRRPRGDVPAIGRWKMLDNLRRSLLADVRRRGPDRRMGHAASRRGGLDRFHPVDDHFAAADSRNSGYRAAPPRRDAAQSFPRPGRGIAPCAHPVRPDDRLRGAPSLADG